jgi:hypothetical protein
VHVLEPSGSVASDSVCRWASSETGRETRRLAGRQETDVKLTVQIINSSQGVSKRKLHLRQMVLLSESVDILVTSNA